MIKKIFRAAKPALFGNKLYALAYKKRIETVTSRRIDSFPSVVNIETTNMCNSKCIICPHSIMKRKPGLMGR